MDILQNARNHRRESASQALGSVEVPEWGEGGVPATIYVRRLNFQEEMHRQSLALDKNFAEYQYYTLIYSACDADMNRIFQDHKTVKQQVMREIDPDVITRVIAKINDIINEKVTGDVDQEKKI